jgi:hypothetical protein
MFTTQTDIGTMPWNNGNSSGYVTTGLTNLNTGSANTLTLVSTDANSAVVQFQPHQAAIACSELYEHYTNDWYLPAREELVLMYQNLVDQNGDSTPGGPLGSTYNFLTTADGLYLSSTEGSPGNQNARRVRFSNGNITNVTKETPQLVRCVRKGPAPRCANPYGIEGSLMYNTTHDVLQFCDGARWIAIGKYN